MQPQLAEDDRPPAILSLQEYLSSNWRPDCDFVDGRSEDRNVGEMNHSALVAALLFLFSDARQPRGLLALPSLRMRVAATRVRVPDVCLIQRGGPKEQVLTHPPLAVIEVLSEADRFSSMMEKLDDYLNFGVENIWIIDPEPRISYRYTAAGLEEVHTGELTVPGTPIRVVLSELFAELDRA